MNQAGQEKRPRAGLQFGGIARWIFDRLRGERRAQPSLALVERITLGPRQFLALVDAEGRRLLVATSADGAPAFYALDDAQGGARAKASRRRSTAAPDGRSER